VWNASRVVLLEEVTSTLDVAHELAAEGTPAGTLIVAETQSAGRGRLGRSWRSEPGAGVWLTLVERPADASALDVLSLRVGLALAPALDGFAEQRISLKWPNDLYVGDRKLAGVLIEARWRESAPEWVAIGVGINLRPPPSEPRAVGLRLGTTRDMVLETAVLAIRHAAAARGPLSAGELAAFAARDYAAGRRCIEPIAGTVQGIDASGALVVAVASGAGATSGAGASTLATVRAGSLVLEEATP
jgi:BirA family biotin operon repressor/biotin-[acetyl-CoA-carboxylase] ligase